MPYEWHKPTQAELDRGILAWYVLIYPVNTAKKGKPPRYVDIAMPCPYSEKSLRRRLARGADMPPFVQVVQPKLKVANELDHLLDQGLSDGEFKKRLSEYDAA